MTGQFCLGPKDSPNYMAMTARQVLSTPDGFVWTPAALCRGLMSLGKLLAKLPQWLNLINLG